MPTLRVKLALLYLSVFGVIQVALCATILSARASDLRRDFDERLADRAALVMEMLHRAGNRGAAADLDLPRWPGYFLQVRRADGTILARSANLGRLTLPAVGADARSPSGDSVTAQTTAGPVAEALAGPAGKLRILTLRAPAEGGPAVDVQVARSLAAVDASVGSLRRLLAVVVSAGLVAAGAASWLLARRALAPIGRIAREARALSAAELDRRIEPPSGRDEVAELVTTINGMLDRLESSFRGQERFIANVSHELKTPVSILLAETQVLAQQARTAEEYDRFVASVQEEMLRIGRIIDSLLLLARAEAGLPPAEMAAVQINEVVADAVQHCQPYAQQREVELVPRLLMPQPSEGDVLVAGDAQLLQALVENLLRNAVRHSPPGATVEIEVGAAGPDVSVAVRDRGPGLPPDHLESVFERFSHAETGPGAQPGAGLGLAIARSVVELHGGSISAANRAGGGCAFVALLPLVPSR